MLIASGRVSVSNSTPHTPRALFAAVHQSLQHQASDRPQLFMTQQFPLFLVAAAQQQQQQQLAAASSGSPSSMGLALQALPQHPLAAQQALMEWINAQHKLGAQQHAEGRHLQLDAAGLAAELNPVGRCDSPEHVVPDGRAASSESTLDAERSPAWTSPWAAEAGASVAMPQTPEPAATNVAAPRKRSLMGYEAMPLQPR